MVSVHPEELRQALAARVARRVEGQGVPRTAVDAAVTRVLDALGTQAAGNSEKRSADVTAAVTARSTQGWTLSFVTEEEGR